MTSWSPSAAGVSGSMAIVQFCTLPPAALPTAGTTVPLLSTHEVADPPKDGDSITFTVFVFHLVTVTLFGTVRVTVRVTVTVLVPGLWKAYPATAAPATITNAATPTAAEAAGFTVPSLNGLDQVVWCEL
jgi:hypothetical protein